MTSQPYGQMRRRDRMMDEAWICDFLHRAPFATLATVTSGQPFLIPVNFVLDEAARAIFVHKAGSGQTLGNIEANDRVCLSAAEMGRLLPGGKGCDFSVEYASVVVFGQASIVADESLARDALQMLLDKYFPQSQPGKDYGPIAHNELDVTTVVRIDVHHWTGKAHNAPTDHPGAFVFKGRFVDPGAES